MKIKVRKSICWMLVLMVVVSIQIFIPNLVYATTQPNGEREYKTKYLRIRYIIVNNTIEATSILLYPYGNVRDPNINVAIPSHIGKYKLTTIDSIDTTQFSPQIITIPESVSCIREKLIDENYFFKGAINGLIAINVNPNNKYYSSKDGVLFNKDKTMLVRFPPYKKITKYSIPAKVKKLSYGAFGQASLVAVTLPKGLTSIPDMAFFDCDNLKTINLNNVKSIGENAFTYCLHLNTISISEGRCKIMEDALPDNCSIIFSNKLDLKPYIIASTSQKINRAKDEAARKELKKALLAQVSVAFQNSKDGTKKLVQPFIAQTPFNGGNNSTEKINFKSFTLIDLDRDGVNEVIIKTTDENGMWYILRYADKKVKAYQAGMRQMGELYTDGTFYSHKNWQTYDILKMKFVVGGWEGTKSAGITEGKSQNVLRYHINDCLVSKETFNKFIKTKRAVTWFDFNNTNIKGKL